MPAASTPWTTAATWRDGLFSDGANGALEAARILCDAGLLRPLDHANLQACLRSARRNRYLEGYDEIISVAAWRRNKNCVVAWIILTISRLYNPAMHRSRSMSDVIRPRSLSPSSLGLRQGRSSSAFC